MARDKESMQDIALYHMERMNRNNPTNTKEKTLAEQIADSKKSPEQQRRESSTYDWEHDLRDLCTKKGVSEKLKQYVSFKYKAEMKQFHEAGSSFNEVIMFINSKQEEHMNR